MYPPRRAACLFFLCVLCYSFMLFPLPLLSCGAAHFSQPALLVSALDISHDSLLHSSLPHHPIQSAQLPPFSLSLSFNDKSCPFLLSEIYTFNRKKFHIYKKLCCQTAVKRVFAVLLVIRLYLSCCQVANIN